MKPLTIALCGNPNVGKSTVFNALTGLRQHTGNWAGKTVASARGRVRDGHAEWTLIDLPGAYSLLDGSPEEIVASDYLAFNALDAVVAVCDATCLERNLNLALQAAQLCPRVVLCVNMMDEAHKRGITLDLKRLEALLGMPVVGVSAGRKQGLKELKRRVTEVATGDVRQSAAPRYTAELDAALDALEPLALRELTGLCPRAARFAALRMLVGSLESKAEPSAAAKVLGELRAGGLTAERVAADVVAQGFRVSEDVCGAAVTKPSQSPREQRQLRLDRLLASKRVGIPLILLMLGVVFYITLWGANIPSAWLSDTLLSFEPTLYAFLKSICVADRLALALTEGLYRVMAWVVSVMLPPMAIFFPLFTLLEDLGFLPRVAFNLDRCFQRCHACGKQALCMCMGLGCNAVGVTGCRIIQSPRERLIAILTNSLMPCNGRFPTLIALLGMFFVAAEGFAGTLTSAVLLVGLIVLSVLATLCVSYLLSRTVLRGVPSSFSLELPPFRRPRVGQVLVRSMLDRTLFVLGRAVAVAAPAGLCLWLLANVQVGDVQLLRLIADFLDPFGRLLGMDGVIVLAFILGFPANEIVLPIIMMIYLSQGALADADGLSALRMLLVGNGWTLRTAACTALFSLFHWPCSTTLLTVYKETGSARWTALSALLPTLVGCAVCMLVTFLTGLL